MSTVRIYKVAELLNTTSQEVLDLLRKNHGIELKSASSTLEEIVARQFVERQAKQRGIELPKGDVFSEQAVKSAKAKSGGPARKPGAPVEPPKPAVPTLGPPRLVKKPTLVKPAGEPTAPPAAVAAGKAAVEAPHDKVAHEPAAPASPAVAAGASSEAAAAVEPSAEPASGASEQEHAPVPAAAAASQAPQPAEPATAQRRPAGRFVPPSIRLRVEEPGQAPPQAPPLVPKRAIVPQQRATARPARHRKRRRGSPYRASATRP